MTAWHDDLVAGLLHPTWGSLGGALAVALATATAIAWMPVDNALADGRVILQDDDEVAALVGALVRLDRARPPGAQVWVVGSSAVREAVSSPTELSIAVQRRGYAGAQLLAAGGLYAQETLAVVDTLPLEAGDLVVVELSERNLGLSRAGLNSLLRIPRLPLRSDAVDRHAAASGLRPSRAVPGSDWLTFPTFWAPRTAALLVPVSSPVTVPHHLVDTLEPPSEDGLVGLKARLQRWQDDCSRRAADHAEAYRAMLGLAQDAGARLVLVDAPRNPRLRPPTEPGGCAEAMAALAATPGITRVDPTRDAGVEASAFLDHAHLIDPRARERWTTSLARALPQANP